MSDTTPRKPTYEILEDRIRMAKMVADEVALMDVDAPKLDVETLTIKLTGISLILEGKVIVDEEGRYYHANSFAG